jgi:hypothetical protein
MYIPFGVNVYTIFNRKNIMNLKKIWNDPVWSKVISQGIIWLIIVIVPIIWSIIKVNRDEIDFKTAFVSILTFKIDLWIILLVTLILVLVYFGLTYFKQNHFSYDEDTIKLDRELFRKIRYELLPQDGSISFLRHNNFAGFSFNLDSIKDIENIEYENRKSDFEFLNPTLEKIKKELLEHISRFSNQINVNTFPTHNGFQTVPPEWEVAQPERFWKVVNDIHTETSFICDKYDEFVLP